MMKELSHRMRCLLLLALCVVLHSTTLAFVPSQPRARQRKLVKPRIITSETVVSREPGTIAASRKQQKEEQQPLLDVKMNRLKLPMMAVGKECVTLPVKIHDAGPMNFMLDTGLTVQIISPRLFKSVLSLEKNNKPPVEAEGLAAGGPTKSQPLVELSGMSLCGQEQDLDLPTFQAIATTFAQENLDRKHPVQGMLGMEMLELFDVDLDFPAGRVRLWAPGEAAEEAKRQGMVKIPMAVINESLLLATRITGKQATAKQSQGSNDKPKQPFIGIIDSGSTFSAVNWEAAQLLGLPPEGALTYLKPPAIMAAGIDGRPLYIPTKRVEFTFCGDALENKQGELVGFVPPPPEWKPWKPVLVGIGDLPMFDLLLGSSKRSFKGPAALIGMDVLSQRRIILESCQRNAKTGRRSGHMFVSPE